MSDSDLLDLEAQPGKQVRHRSIGDRIQARMAELGIERKDLAEHAGCSVQFLSQMFKDPNAGVGADILFRIAEKLDVNERWLQYEQGPMKRMDPWKLEVLEALEGLSDEEKERILWIVRSVKNKQKE